MAFTFSRGAAVILLWAVHVFGPVPAVRGDDWPQWLGPQRGGVWRETGIVDRFPQDGPTVRWRVPVAGGYAGPAVAGGRVFVTDWVPTGDGKPAPDSTGRRVRAGQERVHCLRESDGSTLWAHAYDCPYGIDYGAGPRTTPAVDGDRVYTYGAEGHLLCLDVASGKVIWSERLAGGDVGPVPPWGMASHPLVDGDKVIVLTARPNGVVAALDKRTGKPLWSSLSARGPGYCPPMIFDAAGVRQLIVFHPEAVNSLDPATGALHWSVPYGPVENDVSIVTPRFFRDPQHGELLLISDAWNGTMVIKLTADARGKPSAEVLSQRGGGRRGRGDVLHGLMAAPFVRGGHVYGVHGEGQLRCLDVFSGKLKWESLALTAADEPAVWGTAFLVPIEPRKPAADTAAGAATSADRAAESAPETAAGETAARAAGAPAPTRCVIATEQGDLVLADLSSAEYRETSRIRLLKPTNNDAGRPVLWCHPAFANRSVYWRNDKELICALLAADTERRADDK